MALLTTFRILLGLILCLVVLGVGLYLVAIKPPRLPKGDVTPAEVMAWLDELVGSRAATAVSVAVLRDGEVIWEHATGAADPFADRAATPDSVYHVWSVTKIATALAALDLVEEGVLDLDAEVSAILPWLGIENPDGRPIVVRDLLGHTSGLKDTVPAVFGWLRYDEDLPNQTAFLQAKMPDYRALRFAPGEDRRYSNLGYMVLGAIIEEVTGQDYADVIAARVLGPAGMTASDFVFSSDRAGHEVLGSHPIVHIFTPLLPFLIDMGDFVSRREGQLWWLNRLYVEATPPTGLIASARDVARLAEAAMVPGRVLTAESLSLMLPEAAGAVPLGWNEWAREGETWFQHRGGGPGYAAAARVYPETGLVIAVLASGTAAPASGIADLVARAGF